MNAIEIKGLTKQFKEFNLGPIDLSIPSGAVVGFIGENGAGKSTTIKMMLDIVKRDQGEIHILGEEVLSMSSQTKQAIGVVLDSSEFPETLKIDDVKLIMKNLYSQWDEALFKSYQQKFNLPKQTLVKDYSKGMKMKLAIAVALSHQSRCLILDEPTSGLDPIVREEILDIFLEYMQEEDHTIFVSSHILSDLEKVCDYIAYIHKGQLVFMESKEDLNDLYGIAQVRMDQLSSINSEALVGVRRYEYGAEVLVKRHQLNVDLDLEQASIEQIMLFYNKGVKA